jgi:hypothetical protein
VTPDVAWVGDGLPAYDAGNQTLVDLQTQMTAKLKEMVATYRDTECGR